MTAAQIFAQASEQLDWSRWTRPLFGPLGALREAVRQVDQHLTVAQTHPCDSARGVRLEMAERSLKAARDAADEIELAIAQAREALRRSQP